MLTLDQLLWLRYDDWFFNLVVGLPFFSVIIALFLFFLGNITVDDEIKDRVEVSGKPAGKRPWCFYLLLLILVLVPLLCVFIFYGFDAKTLLGRFPVGLAISSLFADIVLMVSNKRHNIGIRDWWSKAGVAYAILVATAYPILHSACAMGEFTGPYDREWLGIDPFDWWEFYIIIALVVYISSFYAIHFIFAKIAGGEYDKGPKSVRVSLPSDYGDSYIDDSPSYTDPVEPYMSIMDYPEISDDYYGKHGEFDINDESRRVSEDIQQFHRSHPDADLSDHYYWDDILDAETDGYLDEE